MCRYILHTIGTYSRKGVQTDVIEHSADAKRARGPGYHEQHCLPNAGVRMFLPPARINSLSELFTLTKQKRFIYTYLPWTSQKAYVGK